IHGDEFIQNTGLKWLFDNNQIINAKYSDYAIKASSLFSEKEIIVPESYIYYNANSNANIPPNVRGSSNGIAIGNSIREAL
ncbi:YcaO-like family protein, partial [Staphylococcus aureus]|uniref:YcaO-like family protein n=1 Tax=Staphylococcus aureus TaxID=1280 RepID=UPI002148F9DE